MTRCAACGAGRSQPFYGGLTECAACGHVWADVAINDERLRTLYDRHYFFGEEYTNYLEDAPMARRNFARRLRTLERFVPPQAGSLFEIGAAYGIFLDAVRSRFPSVAGIDISEDASRYARTELGLDVRCGDLLHADLGKASFDVVCLWDTIEHLKTPDLYLERIAAHMPAGSLVALTTGDIRSWNARWRKERWRLIHPPTHLHYFSQGSLTRMCDRLGFDVVHTEHCGASRSLGSIGDGILRMRWGWDTAGAWCRRILAPVPVYLNLFDILYVIARKRA